MGFFDANRKSFSDAWNARSGDCSQETLRNLARMAETRLTAHAESAMRLNQLRQTNEPPAPVAARSATEARGLPSGAAPDALRDPAQDEGNRDKIYPIWISNGRNVVGIGAPISEMFPVMAFPRLGHSDVLEKQSLLRIGMAYVSQQLAESIDCRSDWPMAALDSMISLLALRVFVVNDTGHVVYHQRRPGEVDTTAERLIVGELFTLSNKRECAALRDAIHAAIQVNGKSSLLSVTCMGDKTRLALVAPLQCPDVRMAIVVMGQQQVDHNLQYEYFFDSYEMTPSERLVAREVLRGRQLNEIAASTGLSLSTIRSYLKQIFAKTRTHRQIDLVLLYYQVFPGALWA